MLNLQLTQQQKLIMTKQLQASLNILQMPTIELSDYIQQEVENNIVLDAEEVDKTDDSFDKYKKIIEYIQQGNKTPSDYNNDEEEKASPFLFIAQEQTFHQYLVSQVNEQIKEKQMKNICAYIIQELDERGYFTNSIKAVALALGVTEQAVEKALEIIQGLDPLGVGSTNIRQCLKIQVNQKNPEGKEVILIIIDQYLEQVANRRYQDIAKDLRINVSLLQEYIDFIKELEPKPTRGFDTGEMIQYIIPDALIKKVGMANEIIMNDGYLPYLSINTFYKNVMNESIDKESKEYIQKHIQSGLALIKNIEGRKRTLYKVIEAIVSFQKEYFNNQNQYVKPMTLKDIGEIVGIHESTVSRAIQDKYIEIENKMVRMKDLFVQGIYGDEITEISTEKIKDIISKMIKEENQHKPLSDQVICKELEKQNIPISRRTVAKYRESLGILSSPQRKRF